MYERVFHYLNENPLIFENQKYSSIKIKSIRRWRR